MLTGQDINIINGALSAQLRYARRNLDSAKTDEAINRWATFCTQIGETMDKVSTLARAARV